MRVSGERKCYPRPSGTVCAKSHYKKTVAAAAAASSTADGKLWYRMDIPPCPDQSSHQSAFTAIRYSRASGYYSLCIVMEVTVERVLCSLASWRNCGGGRGEAIFSLIKFPLNEACPMGRPDAEAPPFYVPPPLFIGPIPPFPIKINYVPSPEMNDPGRNGIYAFK